MPGAEAGCVPRCLACAAGLLLASLTLTRALAGQTAAAQAVTACPWINQPTASGLLGGETVSTVSEASGTQPGSCTFTQKSQGATRILRISVASAPDAHAQVEALTKACGPDAVPLRGIGNEANVCTNRQDGGPGERVVGRVRDQLFTISLTSTQKGDALLKHDMLRAKIYTASEQVSGNLF